MKYIVIWLALACLIAFGLANFNWFGYRNLKRRGVEVAGVVSEILPEQHSTVRYSYRVDAKQYFGLRRSDAPNPSIGELTPGAKVIVYYDPENPGYSVLGNPDSLLASETGSIALAAVILPALFLINVKRRFNQLHADSR